MDNLGRAHWEGVKHVFRYLAGTRNWGLVYGTKVKGLEGFTDADSATQEHRRSNASASAITVAIANSTLPISTISSSIPAASVSSSPSLAV